MCTDNDYEKKAYKLHGPLFMNRMTMPGGYVPLLGCRLSSMSHCHL